ncbi:helix-turn-helix domain-containing protein [Actinocrispum sp. NPDC049592]|uniref:TetR/AcrR family transcriptional regulator n=1 Tax=Actinocrispum sp. NPDC049592 TaxID=3154835 RepID=UPI003437C556
MARPSRAETQAVNRAKILDAARAQFAARGFGAVKIDEIAEVAGLTRGAVYSNFPGKRALYFAVLAREPVDVPQLRPATTVKAALSSFALVSVRQHSALARDLMPQILAEESSRTAFAQLTRVTAIMLGLALERLGPVVAPPFSRVRLAGMAVTAMQGASQLADIDGALVEPFDLITACEALADLQLTDAWVPQAPFVAEPLDWEPPEAVDALYGLPVELTGPVAFLGLHRLAELEMVARTSAATVVIVLEEPDELGPLVQLALTRLGRLLSRSLAPESRPDVRIVVDTSGAIGKAAGLPPASDRTTVFVDGGLLVR